MEAPTKSLASLMRQVLLDLAGQGAESRLTKTGRAIVTESESIPIEAASHLESSKGRIQEIAGSEMTDDSAAQNVYAEQNRV